MSISHTSNCIVSENNTALTLGSGDLPVLATPALAALMENAAMLAIASSLDAGFTSVGGAINLTHLKPSKIGDIISATATLIATNGKKYEFEILATDQLGALIGKASHTRFAVNAQKFLASINH